MKAGLMVSIWVALIAAMPVQAAQPGIHLVLQITVDPLRGDFVERFGDRFGKGGFRYFLDTGGYCTDIAPTLSASFGLKLPSGSVGEPLGEILR